MKYLILFLALVTSAFAQKPIESLTDPEKEAFRGYTETAADDVYSSANAQNWQPWSFTRIMSGNEVTTTPLMVVRMGDSLANSLDPGPRMAIRGRIGAGFTPTAGNIYVTGDGAGGGAWDHTKWVTGVCNLNQVGSTGEFRLGLSLAASIPGDKAIVIYRTRSGGGSFDLQFQRNDDGVWRNYNMGDATASPDTINTNAASGIVAITRSLSASNGPSYKMRVTNVTGAAVEIIGGGIMYSTGPGIIYCDDIFNRGGLDPNQCVPGAAGNITVAEFNAAVSAINPDLIVGCWSDAAARWDVGNEFDQYRAAFQNAGAFTVGSGATTNLNPVVTVASTTSLYPGLLVSGTGIPSGAKILSVVNGTTFSLTQPPTATGSGLTLTFKRDPDWVMVTGTPGYDFNAAGWPGWVTSTAYTVGQRVSVYDTSPDPDVADIFVCTSSHTSAAGTKPGIGASWTTVWQVDKYDPTALANSTATITAASRMTKDWCARNKQTYWDGTTLFRDYRSAKENGLIADQIHPSTWGYFLRWNKLWEQLSIGQLDMGQAMKNTYPSAGNGMFSTAGPGAPNAVQLQLDRSLVIRGNDIGAGQAQIVFADQSSAAARKDGAAVTAFSANAGEFFINTSGANIFVGGRSSQQGAHPGSDGMMLGGRVGNRWRAMFTGVSMAYRAATGTTSFGVNDYAIHATSGTFTVSLPTPVTRGTGTPVTTNTDAGIEGRIFLLKNTSGNTITVDTATTTRVSGATNSNTNITFQNNGFVPGVGSVVTVTSGTGTIPAGTTVVSATTTSAVISQAASNTTTGNTFTFTPTIDGGTTTSTTVASGSAKEFQSTGNGYISF